MNRTLIRLTVPAVAVMALAACSSSSTTTPSVSTSTTAGEASSTSAVPTVSGTPTTTSTPGRSPSSSASTSKATATSSRATSAPATSTSAPATTSAPAPTVAALPTGDATAFRQRLAANVALMKTYHLVYAITGTQDISAVGDYDLRGAKPRSAVTYTAGATQTDIRNVDGTTYLSLPGRQPAGKFAQQSPQQLQALGLGAFAKPELMLSRQIAQLDGATKVEDLGPDVAAGAPMRKYRVTVDGVKAKARAKTELAQAGLAAAAIDQATKDMPAEIPFTVWVDAQGMVRRTQTTASGQATTMTITNVNVPLDIQSPDVSQIVPAATPGSGSRRLDRRLRR